ncbi:ketosteroid isomerase-like protein [Leeuwenhoekiella aestuarii]|uniref:Ketosteroid isomerase-like protein n=1 Tax=Leeuwenhoekiella aestuarii TaxID=2249426 RepID=A0A4Q0NNI2_9FLAO|nr:nuclear transport factor 2 family protein [Leeuwenhoekiella aestuarii]RXG11511.1 ketosteroid isomerase-like protein [Leeuwenhoekiella aestuarii]RXG12028.1 ketosteroid isomerase-like protein [Leeuwenhoekiella aestuarii]
MRTLFIILILAFTTSCTERNNFSKQQDQNQKIVEQYFEYFNNHNWQKMAEMYLETAEFKDPSLGEGIVKMTTAEIVAKYSELNGIFSDIQDNVIQTYASGEKNIIVEFVSRGTAPDNSKFELPICTIFTIENGKIIKDFSYFDNFEE